MHICVKLRCFNSGYNLTGDVKDESYCSVRPPVTHARYRFTDVTPAARVKAASCSCHAITLTLRTRGGQWRVQGTNRSMKPWGEWRSRDRVYTPDANINLYYYDDWQEEKEETLPSVSRPTFPHHHKFSIKEQYWWPGLTVESQAEWAKLPRLSSSHITCSAGAKTSHSY